MLVAPHMTVRDALQALNETRCGILLVVDAQGRLQRTVTDGDLRRLLLQQERLDASLSDLPTATMVTLAKPASTSAALELMNRHDIQHVPVVDEQDRPVAVIRRSEVGEQILLSTPHLSTHELEFVHDAFRTNWIAPLGPNVDAFERDVATYIGGGHAAAVSSGTAAIHLALVILGVGPGDHVFCSTLTFVATANPILYQGAIPTFIDSEPGTWNMSPPALAEALADAARRNKLPKAVISVNLYGQSADYDALLAVCAPYDIPLVEDAAESLGATYKGRASGTLGRIGIFSFNGNKIITTSGGGMLVADDPALVERARFLATQARDPAPYYQHSQLGFNYRMSNVLAGIGRGQMRVLDDRVAARQAVFERYRAGLPADHVEWMPLAGFGRCTRWLSAGTLHASVPRGCEGLIAGLAAERIEARRIWKPLHLQPLFAGSGYYRHPGTDSVADDLFARGFCLPSGSNMTTEQQDRVIEVIRNQIPV